MLRSAAAGLLGCRILSPSRVSRPSKRVFCQAMEPAQSSSDRQEVVVRCKRDEENLIITLNLGGKERKLNRSKIEMLEKSLGRIRIGMMPKQGKRQKKLKLGSLHENGGAQIASEEVEVSLYESPKMDGPALDTSMTNEEAWCSARVLCCGRDTYDVVLNPPTIDKILLSGRPMVGFPITTRIWTSFVDEDACTWQWFRRREGGEWERLDATRSLYVPRLDDEGHWLRVECLPGAFESLDSQDDGSNRSKKRRIGEAMSVESEMIKKPPPSSSGAGRHELTQCITQNGVIRVVTYNILSDQYSTTEWSLTKLYSYLDTRFLDVEYRMQLVLAELLGFNADIICCQEVDAKVYHDYLLPLLDQNGFDGIFTNKASSVSEGCATFVRKARFSIVQSHDVALKELLSLPLRDSLKMFSPMLESTSDLREALSHIGTIAQISALMPVDKSQDKPLLLANTHLFYHPRAAHIRNMQVYAIIDALESISRAAASGANLETSETAILFCGDLNCDRGGVIKLLTEGKLLANDSEWGNYTSFRWAKDLEAGNSQEANESLVRENPTLAGNLGVDIQLPFKMKSAFDLNTPYTNYTIAFKGLLDYIFYRDEEFYVKNVVPLPSEAQLGKAIPTEIYPSDHLSVVAELVWRKKKSVTPVPAERQEVPAAISHVRDSDVIAMPTDTLYGLAVDANNPLAIDKVYDLKCRPATVPLAICVNSPADVMTYCEVETLPKELLEALLPGPVTLVLKRRKDAPLSANLNPGVETIGVRVPDSDFIRAVCVQGALALTSANRSGQPSSTRVTDFEDLWPFCAAVYDGGWLGDEDSGSTVVDLTQKGIVKVLRDGSALSSTMNILNSFGWQKPQEPDTRN